MLSKHKVGTLMSGFLAVTRRFGLLAVLLVGFAANAYATSPGANARNRRKRQEGPSWRA